MSDAISAKNL